MITFMTGTISMMPHQLGLPRRSATAIHTMIAMIRLTNGIKKRTIHQTGFWATFNNRIMLAIGIHASQLFGVLV